MSSLFSPRSSSLLLLLALLLAVFLRFWQLDTLPPGLYHDEAYYGLDALSLLQGKTFPQFYEGWELYANDAHGDHPPEPTRFPIFFEGNYGREPLHVYLIALSMQIWGITPYAIRFTVALSGTLGVLTTYLAASALLRDWKLEIKDSGNLQALSSNLPALLSAFTLAILYPALHFSRFGIRAMHLIPVETLAVYCFWQGVNRCSGVQVGKFSREHLNTWARERLPAFAWFGAAGFFLGLTWYTFAASRMFPLVFVLFVPLWFWQDRQALRQLWKPVAVMATVAVVTVAPLLWFFVQYPYFFVFRIAYVANKGVGAVEGKPWLTWLANIGRIFRGFFWQGETHFRHNLPGRPYLDPIQALFFISGVWYSLRQLSLRTQFLLIWCGVMILPSLLSGDAPHFGRLTGVAPAVAVLVGYGAAKIVNSKQWAVNSRLVTVYCLLFTAFLMSTFFTIRDYFGRYASDPRLETDFYVPDWELGQYAVAETADSLLYLTTTQEEMATIYYALADPERLHSYAGVEGAVAAGIPGRPALYFVRPDDPVSLQNLQTFFPDGRTGQRQNNFIPFHVPADAPRMTGQETADFSFANTIKLVGWTQTQGQNQIQFTLYWQSQQIVAQDYTAFVHLLNSDGTVAAQLDRPPAGYPTRDWQPGEIVVDTYTIPLPADLPPGQYTIETGFYYLPTLERLGDSAVLGQFTLEDR